MGIDRILDVVGVVTCWCEGDAATKSATWRKKKRQNATEKQQNPGRRKPESGPGQHEEGGMKGEILSTLGPTMPRVKTLSLSFGARHVADWV